MDLVFILTQTLGKFTDRFISILRFAPGDFHLGNFDQLNRYKTFLSQNRSVYSQKSGNIKPHSLQKGSLHFRIASLHVHCTNRRQSAKSLLPCGPEFLYQTAGKRSTFFTNHLSFSSIHDHISSSSTTGVERSQHILMPGVTILTGDLNVFTTRWCGNNLVSRYI